jgi:hypothetical protein
MGDADVRPTNGGIESMPRKPFDTGRDLKDAFHSVPLMHHFFYGATLDGSNADKSFTHIPLITGVPVNGTTTMSATQTDQIIEENLDDWLLGLPVSNPYCVAPNTMFRDSHSKTYTKPVEADREIAHSSLIERVYCDVKMAITPDDGTIYNLLTKMGALATKHEEVDGMSGQHLEWHNTDEFVRPIWNGTPITTHASATEILHGLTTQFVNEGVDYDYEQMVQTPDARKNFLWQEDVPINRDHPLYTLDSMKWKDVPAKCKRSEIGSYYGLMVGIVDDIRNVYQTISAGQGIKLSVEVYYNEYIPKEVTKEYIQAM